MLCNFFRNKKAPQKVFERSKPEDYESDVSNDTFFAQDIEQLQPQTAHDNTRPDLDSPEFDYKQKYVYHETPKPKIYYSSVHMEGGVKNDIKHLSYNWVDTTPTVVSYKRPLSPAEPIDSDVKKNTRLNSVHNNSEDIKRIRSHVDSELLENKHKNVLPSGKRNHKSSYVISSRKSGRSSKSSRPQSKISAKDKESDIYDFLEYILETSLNSEYKIINYEDSFTDLTSDDNDGNSTSCSNALTSSASSSQSSINTILKRSTNDVSQSAVNHSELIPLPESPLKPRLNNRYSIVIPKKHDRSRNHVISKEKDFNFTDEESLLKDHDLDDSVPQSQALSFNLDVAENNKKSNRCPGKLLEDQSQLDNPEIDYINMSDQSTTKKRPSREMKPRYDAIKRNMEFLKLFQHITGRKRNSGKKKSSSPYLKKQQSINPRHRFIKALKKKLKVDHPERSEFYLSLKNMAQFRSRMNREMYFTEDSDASLPRNTGRRVKKKCFSDAKQLNILNKRALGQTAGPQLVSRRNRKKFSF